MTSRLQISAIERELMELERYERRQSVLLLLIQGLGLLGAVALAAWALAQLHLLDSGPESILLSALLLAVLGALVARALDRTGLQTVASVVDSRADLKDELKSALERSRADDPGPWDELLVTRAVARCQDLDRRSLFPPPDTKRLAPLLLAFALGAAVFLFAPAPAEPPVVLVELPPIPGVNPDELAIGGEYAEGELAALEERLDLGELRKRQLEPGTAGTAAEAGEKGDADEAASEDSADETSGAEGGEGSEGKAEDLENLEKGASDETLLDELRRDLEETLEGQEGESQQAANDEGEGQDEDGKQQMGAESQQGEDPEAQQADRSSSAKGEKGDQLQRSDQPKPGDQAAALGEGAQLSGEQKTETDAQAESKGPALGDATGPQAGLAKVLADEIPMMTLAEELALETALLEAKPTPLELAPLEPKEMASPSQDVKLGFQQVSQRSRFARESVVAPPPVPWRHHAMLKRLFPADPPDPETADSVPGDRTEPTENSRKDSTSAQTAGANSPRPSVSQEPE